MPIENFVGVSTAGLDQNNPAGTDPGSDLDNHVRGVKNTLKFTFPNFTLNAQVDATQAHLNNPLLKTPLAANKVPYYTGTTTASTFDITAYGLSLVAQPAAANVLSLLGADSKYANNNATNAGNIGFTGTVTAAALTITSTAPTVTFQDTDWGNRSLHNNGGLIGFLNSTGGWAFYSDNSGNTTTPGTAYCGELYLTSDPRLKSNIRPISEAAAETFVRTVRGYTYTLNSNGKLTSGVLSPEVKTAVPALVEEHEGFDRVNEIAILPYLLVNQNATTRRMDDLNLELRALRDEITELRRIVEMTVAPTTGAPQ